MGAPAELWKRRDYASIIEQAHQWIADDRRVLWDADLKAWLALRWRNLFLNEAVHDQKALGAASRLFDRRPNRQKIAERYLLSSDRGEWRLEMPTTQAGSVKNTTLLFCPGLINGLLPARAFEHAFPGLVSKHGVRVLRADCHPVRGAGANGADISKALQDGFGRNAQGHLIPPQEAVSPGNVFMVGYSKGSVDIIHYLAAHPEMKHRVKAVFNWDGPVGGSPAANDVFAKIKDKNLKKLTDKLHRILGKLTPPSCKEPVERLDEYDIKAAVRDLTVEHQTRFLQEHRDVLNDLQIPMFTVAGATRAPDVPLIQMMSYLSLKKYGPNDMQVTFDKTSLPVDMHIPLGLLHGQHWDMAYPAFVKRKRLNNMYHPFPKEAAVTAMFLLCAELGLID